MAEQKKHVSCVGDSGNHDRIHAVRVQVRVTGPQLSPQTLTMKAPYTYGWWRVRVLPHNVPVCRFRPFHSHILHSNQEHQFCSQDSSLNLNQLQRIKLQIAWQLLYFENECHQIQLMADSADGCNLSAQQQGQWYHNLDTVRYPADYHDQTNKQ